jgi:hypothetical protein
LTINGDVTFAGGALKIEVAGLNDGQFDILEVFGTADFSNGLIEFAFIDGFLPSVGDSFEFVRASSILGLSSASFAYSGLADGFLFDVSVDGNDLRFVARNNGLPIPEPGTLALLGLGLAGLAATRRRKQ